MPVAFLAGAGIGLLRGMIGLGGAEFRLPLLIGLFGFLARAGRHREQCDEPRRGHHRVTGPPRRGPFAELTPHWPIVANLLAGSLAGAWAGASWVTRMRTATLHKSSPPSSW